MARRELGIWRRLEHDNIVPFLGIAYGFGRQECASLVSLWMPNGTLQKFLAEQDDKLTVTRQLQLVLHSFSLVHGDLNCNNVLLDANFNARIADFGYASLIGETHEALAYLQMSTMQPGAIRWAAPEQILQQTEETVLPTTKSDIYSFGNIALQARVFSGKQPWSEVRQDAAVILLLSRGDKPSRPQSRPIDDRYWEFTECCWENIEKRPSANDTVFTLQHLLASHQSPPPPSPSPPVVSFARPANSQPTFGSSSNNSHNDVLPETQRPNRDFVSNSSTVTLDVYLRSEYWPIFHMMRVGLLC
ncbi:kinase-like domain-containing protein [Melanogaster broomeanus]|nr:kinase-like domain-containing protein [Melanogaster broomeanus]